MRLIGLLMLCLCLGACTKPAPNTLVIGTVSGPETELVLATQEIAQKKYGLTIKIVEFNDYNLPNEALNEGSLDANVYQHLPYLQAAKKAHGYQLTPIGKTFLYPVGLYSKRFHKLKSLPKHAVIALPNDPSNEARALRLLQQAGFITLSATDTPGLHDIKKNPRHLQFKSLDAAQLPRVLPDVDAAIINTTFAIPAGLKPSRDALLLENKHSPYANIIVIQDNSLKKEQLDLFVLAFHSQAVKDKAKQLFGDAAIPAW
jgi:D-methionine transport system substrate-binding protein